MSLAELTARRRAMTPVGLTLDTVFHADARVALARWFGRRGEYGMWCGLFEGVPFEVVIGQRAGFGVRLPRLVGGDDARLDVIERLPLPPWARPLFETTPHGDGFAIVDGHGAVGVRDLERPTYWSASYDTALACLELIRRRAPAARQLVAVSGLPPRWFVDGPTAGDVIASRTVAASLADACQIAHRLSELHGITFTVTDSRHLEPTAVVQDSRLLKPPDTSPERLAQMVQAYYARRSAR
nr:hypothetical protein [Kofleriaceae bacterium]